MGDFKKNPKKPFEVRVPNKIRKRIAMHFRKDSFLEKLDSITRLEKVIALPSVPVAKKRGSLWSRFSNGVKNFMQHKDSEGRLK